LIDDEDSEGSHEIQFLSLFQIRFAEVFSNEEQGLLREFRRCIAHTIPKIQPGWMTAASESFIGTYRFPPMVFTKGYLFKLMKFLYLTDKPYIRIFHKYGDSQNCIPFKITLNPLLFEREAGRKFYSLGRCNEINCKVRS